jgi:alpha 1,2-mannosyltransferase
MPIINRRILRGLTYTVLSLILIIAIFLFSNVHEDYNSQAVYNKLFDGQTHEPQHVNDGVRRLANFYDPLADKTLNQVHINPNLYEPIKFDEWFIDTSKPEYTKMNATMVSLVRNEELSDMLTSIEEFEASFNHKYHYDWVFLNDKEFTPRFKKQVTEKCSGNVKFGLVPEEHWSYPDFIDQDKAAQTRIDMANVIYGSSESYRFMCRYQSGFFWRHPIMLEYDWYWRVEPSTRYPCNIPEDLFKYMNDNEKIYGFTQSLHEYEATIPTLYDSVLTFTNNHPQYVPHKNFASFISEDDGETYNGCHFWSNFEIANMKLWRSKQYNEFFDYLDKQGGFFYERHGDAPVHSVFASIFLPMDQIEYLNIGYYHVPFWNVPYAVGKNSDSDDYLLEKTKEKYLDLKCKVDPRKDFTINGFSCGELYFRQKKLRTLHTVPDDEALDWMKITGATPKEE